MTDQPNDTRPLSGVRVLDIATFLAGPFCATIMGDFGAEVIKVEHPKMGDPLRGFGTPTSAGDTFAWLSESRNKSCITLDLRAPEGASMFRDLVAKCDVLIENFRPGTLEKWGLSPDSLREINPRLVVLRVSAYGQTGPKRGWSKLAPRPGCGVTLTSTSATSRPSWVSTTPTLLRAFAATRK